MLDFFETNGISPNETLGPNIKTLESQIKKRINAVIAIINDIEKNHDKPTTAML
ncbi:BfmA/BtgA family mobilization protein [Winogradskyella wichelsiae]|uniref:BfmA/BtgA family mobilization protein n=1 Tax=Winogradskyella wichelsiae TaxID=2697007 RepID=UPI003EF80F2A